ncbi:hypothetical protein V1L52_04805 [Treponema sp. HNW]|uniref:hypothetical protein n=1 Tax=Treponema sp. HNW TaxID=3116654 RepID=UPI003D143509
MKLCSVNIDDSDGVLSSLALVCADLWRDLFLLCGTDLKQAMYKQIKKILEKDIPDYMEEYIERVLFDNFSENDFLHDKLILCDTHIRLLSEPGSDSQNERASYIESLFSTDDYNISKWVQYRIQVMKQLLFAQEDIDAYCKRYMGFTDIRTYYIEECIRTERLDEAIVLLDEGKELFKNLPGIVHKYSYILKDLYLKTNRAEDYKRELWNLVLKYARGDFEIYKELKILYTEDEWKNEREKIFAYARNVYTLYDYEGLYDRILDKALHQDGLYYIIYYEDKIRDLDPEGILKKYEAVIRSMAEPVSGRAVYGEIAGYLKRMKSYSGGKEIVKGILEEFRITYKNRPAMMDELSRVKV